MGLWKPLFLLGVPAPREAAGQVPFTQPPAATAQTTDRSSEEPAATLLPEVRLLTNPQLQERLPRASPAAWLHLAGARRQPWAVTEGDTGVRDRISYIPSKAITQHEMHAGQARSVPDSLNTCVFVYFHSYDARCTFGITLHPLSLLLGCIKNMNGPGHRVYWAPGNLLPSHLLKHGRERHCAASDPVPPGRSPAIGAGGRISCVERERLCFPGSAHRGSIPTFASEK